MGDFSREVVQPENEEYDENEEEEEQRGRRMLSILFGNVDDSGDLDEEYLDQDAKEHLSALAGQLGQSLVDIELSARRKGSGAISDVVEEQEDYGRKADDAVDYEDIQEQYEGPEVQIHTQDEQVISQDQHFYAQAALAGPSSKLGAFVLEEENYDEEEDYDKEDVISTKVEEALTPEGPVTLPRATEELNGDTTETGAFLVERETELEFAEPLEDKICTFRETQEVAPKLELPVLCEEDGKEVLRFSKLFGHQEPHWLIKNEKRHQKRPLPRGKPVVGHADALEEDEEVLLKSFSAGHMTLDEVPVDSEEEFQTGSSVDEEDSELDESSKFITQSNNGKLQVKSKKYFCISAQPMKEDIGDWDSVFERMKGVTSPNLHSIHQEDWEATILWDAEHLQHVLRDPVDNAKGDSSVVFEEMDTDTREEDAFCMRDKCNLWQTHLSKPVGEEIKHHMGCQSFKPIVVEPLCHLGHTQGQSISRHPQLLRLEALPVLKEVDKQCGNKADAKGDRAAEIIHSLQKLSLQNDELLSGSWLDQIIWDDESLTDAKLQCSKVIFDLQDDQMVFEIPESKDGQYLRAHAAAMIVTPPSKSTAAEVGESHNLGFSSLARFNISNDKYYMNKKNPQQHKSNAKKRAVHGIKVMHSLPATKLQTMKPKLTNKDLANFHRPKAVWYPHHNEVAAKEQGKLSVKGPMKVILKIMGGKGSKLYVDASETLEAVKAKSAKKLGDLKATESIKILYSGKELEDDKTLAQQEVKPNSVLHLVRTKVHPWPRAQKVPGENKPSRPPGAFKKKSELSVKDGHVVLVEYCEERPLLLGNVGMGARLSTYYRKLTPTDSTAASLRIERGPSIGIPLPLEPTEDSPFLGDIRPGDTQSCLETNMYRAPAFPHKVAQTDFLLVRSAKGKLSLRRIDNIHVIGQQEPHMEVLTPSSKSVQNYIGNRLLVYMYREFRDNEKPGFVPRVRGDEVTAQFPSLSEGYLRKRLKHCADLQKGSGGEIWWLMKRNFRIPSEEELRRMVTPENVCTYESMQAGLYHLKRMGVNKLTQPSGLSAAMNQLPDEAIALAAGSHIERELQITPWNLSCNFVAATMQGRGSLERLEITGAGDPSGRGLGFSYLRVAPKAPGSGALVEKKAAAARGGGAVTGTDADLRRLSMDAAREVLLKFNVPEAQIDKMTRWHRIALVRKLSSEQAASGVKVGVAALNKFARGQRMSFLQLQQQTREKCQEIWDRQVQSLSTIDGDNSESDGEANEDLDSFAGDLENLLEAEEGEAEEVASKKGKKEIIRGMGARRRALEAQREEEIEDEEAEAAELRRMLMEDDEAEEGKKKKKSGNGGKDKKDKEDPTKEQHKDVPDVVKVNGTKKKKKVIKRIIRTRKADGTYTSKEILITDPKEVAQYLAKKNAAQNGNPAKDPKKSTFLGKKEKKTASVKDGKKLQPKKSAKGEPGRDGLRVICGACKQPGHMRTNKKVCPLYTEDGKATLQKSENVESEEPSVRQAIKITLKKASGAVQKKTQQLEPEKNSKSQKIPSLKIKLPFSGPVEAASGSTRKLNENDTAPAAQEEDLGPLSGNDLSRRPDGNSLDVVKKKKSQKKHKRKKENISQREEDMFKVTRIERTSSVGQLECAGELERRELVRRDLIEKKRQYELEVEAARERERAFQRQREEEMLQRQLEEEERLTKQKEEEERRKQREKQKIKEEKEKRRAKQREERLRREEEERERLRLEMQMELERQAEIERQREFERQREMERQRESERQREMERQRELERFREQEERERQKQRRANEKRKAEEKATAKRGILRDRRSMEKDRGNASKRRASLEMGASRRFPDYATQPKRRKGGEVLLANILETVVDVLRKRTEVSYLFLKPVTKKEAPDYLDVIRYPMDLSTIREKVRKMVYKSREEFHQDVWQIAENAHIYNDHRNPGIPPLADRLLEICDGLLEERNDELVEAESAVERIEEENLCTALSPVLDRRRTPRFH